MINSCDLHGICRGGFSLFGRGLILTFKGFRVGEGQTDIAINEIM